MSSSVEVELLLVVRFVARRLPERDAEGETFLGAGELTMSGLGEAVLNGLARPLSYCKGEGSGNCIVLLSSTVRSGEFGIFSQDISMSVIQR